MPIKRKRSAAWVAPDSVETVKEIAKALDGFQSYLSREGIGIYESMEMKKDVCRVKLLFNRHLLLPLMKLDPRGAIFGNNDLFHALKENFKNSPHEPELISKAHILCKTKDEFLLLLAYKIRVMCSHVRMLADEGFEKDKEGVGEIFQAMHDREREDNACASTSTQWTARKARKS